MGRKSNFLWPILEDFNEENIPIVSDENNKIMEGIKGAFGSPGGKFFVAGKLISYFPEHKRYVEPFIGGGSVLFRKQKESEEFINDKDGDIFFAYKFMQDLSDQQLESLNKFDWKTSKDTFGKLLNSVKEGGEIKDPCERFYRLCYLKAASDAGCMESYDDRAEGEVMKVTSRLGKIKERLAGVTIENMDYKDFVNKYSDKESFTFLDPPYPSANLHWKWCPTQAEFESFSKTVPGKWMITYEICDGWKESKYHRMLLSQYNVAAPSVKHMSRKNELVVTNYPAKIVNVVESIIIDEELAKESIDFITQHDLKIEESTGNMQKELKSILKLYAAKRRGEEVKQSFDEIKNSFRLCVSKMIESGFTNFKPDRFPAFAGELFDKYTDYGYSVPMPDGKVLEVRTLKDLKEQNIDYRGYKFHISMKEAQDNIEHFIYQKQWWKGKNEESNRMEDFIISTGSFDLFINKDILSESFNGAAAYFKKTKLRMSSIKEAIQFIPPNSNELNMTALPSWIKILDSGKIVIKESSELEKTIEFSGSALKGIYAIKRENPSSDFWVLNLKT